MVYGIDFGHTEKGANYGAVGILKESEETRRVGKLVIKYLKELGHTVVNCTVDHATSNTDSINKRVANANKQYLDMFISLHFNIGGGAGHGVEIFTYNGKYLKEADRVLKNIEKLGYRNRGIKNGTSPRKLGVVNSTKAPSMLIECMFIDNKDDVARYNPDKMARAIAEGITGQKIPSNATGQEQVNNTQNTKPKGDELIVKFEHKWQEELLVQSIEKLAKQGLIQNENDWIDKFKEGRLTVSELSLLSLAVSSRIIDKQ